jgi:hypothetical protein
MINEQHQGKDIEATCMHEMSEESDDRMRENSLFLFATSKQMQRGE